MSDVYMRILLSAQSGNTMSVVNDVAKALGSGGLGGVLLGIGVAAAAAAVGIGVAATKMAGDYQQAMNMVQALTGSSADQMAQYDAGLKQLAIDAGVAPTELSKGLYNVLSASFRGADAMRVLTLATEDSKIGMTSASVATDALTNILRSFGTQSGDITRVNGEMLQTVTLGKSTFEQYASTIVKAASSANQFHVSMETMNAAWATMTSSGIKAAQASTDFQQSLKVMYGNIGTVTKSLHSNGIAFDEAKFNAMSYGDKVVYLNNALEQANAKHVKVTGVTLQAAQAIQTISKHIGDYNSNLASLSDKQAMADKTQQAWAITQSGFNQSMSRLSAVVQVLMINLGTKLLPVATNLATAITPLVAGFTSWLTSTDKTNSASALFHQTLTIVQNVIKALTPAFQSGWDILQKIGAFLKSTFEPVWKQLVDTFKTQLQPAWNEFMDALRPAMPSLEFLGKLLGGAVILGLIGFAKMLAMLAQGGIIAFGLIIRGISGFVSMMLNGLTVVGNIVHWVIGVWQEFPLWWRQMWAAVQVWAETAWKRIQQGISDAWNGVVSFFKDAWKKITDVVQGGINTVVGWFKWLYDHNYYFHDLVDNIKSIITNVTNWLKDTWATATKWLGDKWNEMKGLATSAWNTVSSVFSSAWNTYIAKPLADLWSSISKWWSDSQAKSQKAAGDFWRQVSGVFSSAWNTYIAKPLSNMGKSISDWFGGIINSAYGWGKNLVQGFINGLNSMAASVSQTASSLASNVAKFLGFHSPAKEGPGADLMTWGTGLISGFSQSIKAALPTLDATMRLTAQHVAAPLTAPLTAPTVASNPNNRPDANASGGHTFNIYINTMARSQSEVKTMVNMVEQELSQRLRRSGVFTSTASGGRAVY